MITVTRGSAYLGGVVLAALALTACGSDSRSVPTARAAPTLVAPPATIPADYRTLGAILAPLKGVAQCSKNGPASAVCSLVTTTTNAGQISIIRPFQVKVFTSTQAVATYVTLVKQTNVTRAGTDSAVRQALVGPHWVVIPQTTTADLLATVKQYLGGSIVD